MEIKWSDGRVSRIDGEYRVEREPDGWVVLGHGLFIPVDSEKEGEEIIAELNRDTPMMKQGREGE